MSKTCRLGVVLISAGLIALVVDSPAARAQRVVIGSGQSNQNNRDRDEDERDEDENQNQQGKRSSRSGNRTNEQVQQFLQGRQGGQNFQQQGDANQFGRGNRQGQFQGGQFQGGQFQQFRPQKDEQDQLRFGNWQGNEWRGSRDVEKWAQVFGGGNRPFSSEWYEKHPKAWKHEHDHDNIWVVATLPGVYTWLGWGNAPQQPGVRIGNAPQVDLSRFHDWYPLGVYSLMSGPGDMGTRIVQLSIDRHGHIKGNYYDMISDSNWSVTGDIRRQSQRVSWSLGKNPSIRFRSHISQLLQPYGTVTLQMPGGEQDWQFVRLED